MEVGTVVTWKSQAGGFWKEKTGAIIEVVPPKRQPKHRIKGGTGFWRGKESYVVKVGSKLYWPVASILKVAMPPEDTNAMPEADAAKP